MNNLKCIHGLNVFSGAVCIECEKLNREHPECDCVAEISEEEDGSISTQFLAEARGNRSNKAPIEMTKEQQEAFNSKINDYNKQRRGQ